MEYGFNKRPDGGGFNRENRDRDRNFGQRREFGDRDNRGGDQRGGGFQRREPREPREDRGDRDESVFSKRVRAGRRRTYFFDVRKTRGEDFFITITESTRREDGFGYRRHKIFLYKEDFNRFVEGLTEVVNHVKTDLMPDFDYEEFDRRQAEWEASNKENAENGGAPDDHDDHPETEDHHDDDEKEKAPVKIAPASKDDDDMNW